MLIFKSKSLPETDCDPYLDVPTTPISDISGYSDSDVDLFTHNVKPTDSGIESKIPEIASLSSLNDHVSNYYLEEIEKEKSRFEMVLKFASKIKSNLSKPDIQMIPELDVKTYALAANKLPEAFVELEREVKRMKTNHESVEITSQKSTLQETRLSSQLTRLECLLKESKEKQGEILGEISLIKEERVLKDERYSNMISLLCNGRRKLTKK